MDRGGRKTSSHFSFTYHLWLYFGTFVSLYIYIYYMCVIYIVYTHTNNAHFYYNIFYYTITSM